MIRRSRAAVETHAPAHPCGVSGSILHSSVMRKVFVFEKCVECAARVCRWNWIFKDRLNHFDSRLFDLGWVSDGTGNSLCLGIEKPGCEFRRSLVTSLCIAIDFHGHDSPPGQTRGLVQRNSRVTRVGALKELSVVEE